MAARSIGAEVSCDGPGAGRDCPASAAMTLAEVREHLHRLVALADTAERPRPTAVLPPGHRVSGWEWTVEQHPAVETSTRTIWCIRAPDAPDGGFVHACPPDFGFPEDFGSMSPPDARRVGLAFLAAADRAEQIATGVPRLDNRRPR